MKKPLKIALFLIIIASLSFNAYVLYALSLDGAEPESNHRDAVYHYDENAMEEVKSEGIRI